MQRGLHEEISFTKPKKGISKSNIPVLIFATLWLLLVAFWTFFAAMGSIWFALFSIPFWIIGFGLFFGTLLTATQTEVITLTRHSIVIEKKRIILSKTVEINHNNILSIELQKSFNKKSMDSLKAASQSNNALDKLVGLPNIKTDGKNHRFFTNANPKEKKWIVSLLNHLVTELNK